MWLGGRRSTSTSGPSWTSRRSSTSGSPAPPSPPKPPRTVRHRHNSPMAGISRTERHVFVCAGYRCLWSTDGVWYLDGLGTTWQTMYKQEPCAEITDEACNTLMMGGGGEQWGEPHDPCWHLGCSLPRVPSMTVRNRGDRRHLRPRADHLAAHGRHRGAAVVAAEHFGPGCGDRAVLGVPLPAKPPGGPRRASQERQGAQRSPRPGRLLRPVIDSGCSSGWGLG